VNEKDGNAKDEDMNEGELFYYLEDISRKREHYQQFRILSSVSADNAIITIHKASGKLQKDNCGQ